MNVAVKVKKGIAQLIAGPVDAASIWKNLALLGYNDSDIVELRL